MTNIESLLGQQLKEDLLDEAVKQGRSMQAVLQDAVKEYLGHGGEEYLGAHRRHDIIIGNDEDPPGG